jgi:hypothetical protein
VPGVIAGYHAEPVRTAELQFFRFALLILSYRAELPCNAYFWRKNRERSLDNGRPRTGPKVDGIIHHAKDRRCELGVLEGATMLNHGENSSKWHTDQAKMRKLLRDILGALVSRAKFERRVVEKLQVFGISTAGFSLQTLRMTQPKGYMCLLKLDAPLEVPQSVETFRLLPVVLSLILKIKVRHCSAHSCLNHGLIMVHSGKTALSDCFKASRSGLGSDQLEINLEVLQQAGNRRTPECPRLPFPADTP